MCGIHIFQCGIYLYLQQRLFLSIGISFLYSENIFSRLDSIFWTSRTFFLPQNIFCDSDNFGAQHNFYIFNFNFFYEIFFLLTQFFVQHVTVLNNKRTEGRM